MEWIKNIKFRFNFANFLAFYIVTFCMIFFFYISSNRFPVALVKEISDVKIALITVMTGIISYYFGSSKSSKEKDDIIKQITPDKKS